MRPMDFQRRKRHPMTDDLGHIAERLITWRLTYSTVRYSNVIDGCKSCMILALGSNIGPAIYIQWYIRVFIRGHRVR